MKFVPFVYDSELNRINVDIVRMSQADADVTDSFPMWQTSWNSDFLNDGRFENYSMKAGDELLRSEPMRFCRISLWFTLHIWSRNLKAIPSLRIRKNTPVLEESLLLLA